MWKNKKCELLSPAGCFDALKAAIENGADAVYLGGKLYNARQFAGNFDNDEMLRAIEYAHLRGVKLYLTLNTLLRDHELGRALEYAAFMREQGMDAIIVQDLGFASEIRRQMPDLPLHASTQMTIYDANGARVLEDMGFERIVLARELSLDEIKEIKSGINAEIEVFVHGALCVSYSGQCLMSSMIGGRSGNRGTCAQNCRMKYELIEKSEGLIDSGYLLSTRDINSLSFLKNIVEAGVDSLKIEGRMKSPEYVGLVTSKYRKALDHIYNSDTSPVDEKDENELMQIFNRGGFSSGYFFGKDLNKLVFTKRPKNMGIPLGTVIYYDEKRQSLKVRLDVNVSLGDGIEVLNNDDTLPGGIVTCIEKDGKFLKQAFAGDIVTLSRIKIQDRGTGLGIIRKGDKVIKTSDKELNDRVASTYSKSVSNKRRSVSGIITIKESEPARLKLVDDEINIVADVTGDVPEKATGKGLTEERVAEQTVRTGEMPFYFSSLKVFLDKGLYLPVSSINDLRRKALAELSNKIINSYKRSKLSSPAFNPVALNYGVPVKNALKRDRYISLYIYCFDKLKELFDGGVLEEADRIYIPAEFFMEKDRHEFIGSMKNSLIDIEVIAAIPNITRGKTSDLLEKSLPVLLKDNVVDGIMIGNLGQLFFTSGQDKPVIGDIGLNAYNSVTMNKLENLGIAGQTFTPELKPNELPSINKGEYIVYGRIPVMTTEHNPVDRVVKTGSHNEKEYFLKDRKGALYPIIFDEIGNRTIILSSRPVEVDTDGIMELMNKGINGFRVNIYHETAEKSKQIVSKIKNIVKE